MTFKQFVQELTEEQKQNWRDYREAEKLLPDNSNIPVWAAVDIIRLRRKGNEYNGIKMITGCSYWAVSRVCKLAGLGRVYKC